ncbi:hypothetical protein NHF50_00650 [Flavobacterium sp. NRK F10]|uniref:hypothetical protein n=1 Tax=Flavobacterium sp. NRK F10 TaxID=2954931 RepID=UPI002090551D|nr:hypothetical protein [Flavobacterium sp. NRK F10]MCO6173544.1 hypothetical protein [Flavobacterium sp. NRK F10]
MKKKIEDKLMYGYSLDLGVVIEEGFAVYKKTFLISGLALILLSIVFIILYLGLIAAFYGLGNFSELISQISIISRKPTYLISTGVFSTIASAIMAPVTAGFIHVNYLAKRNREFSLSTYFEFYKGKYVIPLMTAYAIIGFTMSITNVMLAFVGLNFLSFITQGLISMVTIFTIPLIIYDDISYSEALSKSITLFGKQPLYIFVALLVAFFFSMLGFIAFCIGIIFTIPFLYSTYYSIYEQAIGFEEKSEIEEIGTE